MWSVLAPLWFADVFVLGHKRNVVGCNEVAPWLSHWPGQISPKCDHHLGWAKEVARAMGFELVATPLPVRTWPEPDASSQRFAAMELN